MSETKQPNNLHCWHATGLNTDYDQDKVCCWCGMVYDANEWVALPGHGPHSPDRVRPKIHPGPCPAYAQLLKPEGRK